MKKEDIKKVVLAYSGGLDTSIIIPWLKENYNNCEVVAVSGDVGQGTELDGLEEKAKKTGASKLYILDLKKDFVENYIFPTLKFGAKYEDYLLGTSFARPCIAKALADICLLYTSSPPSPPGRRWSSSTPMCWLSRTAMLPPRRPSFRRCWRWASRPPRP